MIKSYGFYVQYHLFNQFGGIFHSMTTEMYKDEKINYLIWFYFVINIFQNSD